MSGPGLFERRALAILLALTALFYWKLLFSGSFTTLDSPDLSGQVLPWYNVQARAWHEGVYPMWDPYVWGGQPLLGQMQPGAAFPLNWPLFAAPLKDGTVSDRWIHMHWALMHLLAAGFAFALARELGCSRFASLLAGFAFACGGFLRAIMWPQMLNGAVWLPLTLLFLHRAMNGGWTRRGIAYAALCGGSIGLSVLSGHHQTPFFSLLAATGLAAYFLWDGWRESRSRGLRWGLQYALAGGVALLVSSLQLFPALEYSGEALRWVGAAEPIGPGDEVPYFVHRDLRLYPVSLLGLVIPQLHFQVDTHVGWTMLALAIFAVATCWDRRWVKVYSVLGLAALSFSTAAFSPLHGWIYQFVPYADVARSASHAVFIPQLAVFLLAAFGVDRLLAVREGADDDQKWLKRLQFALAGSGAALLFILYRLAPDGGMEAHPGDQMLLAALLAFLLAAVLQGWKTTKLSKAGLCFSLTALVLSEMYPVQWFEISDKKDPNRQSHLARYEALAGAMSYLRERQGEERFRFELAAEDNNYNVGAMYGVEQVNGFLATVNRDLYAMFGTTGWTEARLLMNTRYTVAKEKQRDAQELVFEQGGWKVFRNPDASPRAWLQHNADFITTPEGGAAQLPAPRECETAAESVDFDRWTIHRALIRVRTACPAYLIVGDPHYPGWQANVDGRKSEVYRYRSGLRAVFLPAGEHLVEFLYRPQNVVWGGVLTALGFALAAVAALVAWRTGRPAATRPHSGS